MDLGEMRRGRREEAHCRMNRPCLPAARRRQRPITDPRLYRGLAILCAGAAFDVPVAQIERNDRRQPWTFARQVAMWLLVDVCSWPTPVVGAAFLRHHGAVLNACHTVENRIATELSVRERCAHARGLFVGPSGINLKHRSVHALHALHA